MADLPSDGTEDYSHKTKIAVTMPWHSDTAKRYCQMAEEKEKKKK